VDSVVQTLTFSTVRYADLIANTTLQTAFKDKIKETIATSVGVPESNVDVELAQASRRRLGARGFDRRMGAAAGVEATVTIRPTANTALSAIATSLQESSMQSTLNSALATVPGLDSVVEGGNVSSLVSTLVAPVTHGGPSTATTTTTSNAVTMTTDASNGTTLPSTEGSASAAEITEPLHALVGCVALSMVLIIQVH
jgi:hypothetical protein